MGIVVIVETSGVALGFILVLGLKVKEEGAGKKAWGIREAMDGTTPIS